ncbi:MAG: serine/threonine-protein kinase, partial [Planctomycetota bacterium]
MNPKRALPNVSMTPGLADGLTEQQQLKLTEILDSCLENFESGRSVDHDALIAANPELAGPLAEYFESLKFLYEASSGIRPHPTETENAAPQNIGEYRILREIGRGGMGVVYEAEDSALLRRVALKVLPFAALLDQKQIARFHNEAQASGQLHHPHIVPVYSVGCDRGVHFFAMQLVEGQPLDVAIGEMRAAQLAAKSNKSSGAKITPACESTSPWHSISTVGSHRSREYMRIIAELAANVADGLQHAHEFGILHRDIKPSNLLLDQTGKVWITDFGLAHLPNNES